MFKNPSVVTRVGIGKAIGLAFGLLGLICFPYFMPEVGWLPRIGILLWHTTLGAIIGAFGVFTFHPVLKFPMPWWVRAPFLGAWMNFILTFFAYDVFQTYMIAVFGAEGVLQSPFWFTAEGALIGLVIGYVTTRYGGEGKAAAGR